MTSLLEVVAWDRLPPSTRPIASMLVTGYTQREIAKRLRQSEDWVAKQVGELRTAMVEQALARADELPPALRERLEQMRESLTR